MKRLTRLAVLALVLALGALALTWVRRGAARDPIRVGVLHSLTGTMAISERAVVDATLARLADKSYVTFRISDPRPVQGGRARKHVLLTPAGKRALGQSTTMLTRMLPGLTPAADKTH